MNRVSYLSLFVTLLAMNCVMAQDEAIQLKNPSFEDRPHAGRMDDFTGKRTIIKDWQDCGQFFFKEETPPDIHPNDFWDVNLGPSEGDTYVGMVVRKQETWESISQRLNTPIQKNKCYEATLDLARSDNYWSATKETVQNVVSTIVGTAREVNFTEPAVLRIWGGSGFCNDKQLLWESPPIDNSTWKTFQVSFESKFNHNYITLEAYFKTPTLFPYNGHILLDNISDIKMVPCDGEEKILALNQPKPKKKVPPHQRRTKNPPVKKEPKKDEVNIDTSIAKVTPEKMIKELDRKAIKVGQTIEISNLYFAADATEINDKSHQVLDEVYDFLMENRDVAIEIGGHTNGVPSHKYCDNLSQVRAKSVANYLISKGVPATRVQFKGYGKRRPLATNKTEEGRKKNQRVEIKILSLDNVD